MISASGPMNKTVSLTAVNNLHCMFVCLNELTVLSLASGPIKVVRAISKTKISNQFYLLASIGFICTARKHHSKMASC